jgi:hypothetical protein
MPTFPLASPHTFDPSQLHLILRQLEHLIALNASRFTPFVLVDNVGAYEHSVLSLGGDVTLTYRSLNEDISDKYTLTLSVYQLSSQCAIDNTLRSLEAKQVPEALPRIMGVLYAGDQKNTAEFDITPFFEQMQLYGVPQLIGTIYDLAEGDYCGSAALSCATLISQQVDSPQATALLALIDADLSPDDRYASIDPLTVAAWLQVNAPDILSICQDEHLLSASQIPE